MEYIEWYGTEHADGDNRYGHTVDGCRLRASSRVPLERWLWLSETGNSYRNMTVQEQEASALEYLERSSPPEPYRSMNTEES